MGLILTYLLVLPALLYAFHRRHWILRKLADLRLRRKIGSGPKTPRRVRSALDRLDPPELEVLLECLKSDSTEPPRIYGHKLYSHGKWYLLPDSTFSRLVRIPEILEALKTDSERSDSIHEVEARLRVLETRPARTYRDRKARHST